MATFKELKKAVTHALRKPSIDDGPFNAEVRVRELIQRLESFSREDMAARRQRALRVSTGGMYVDPNVGSYASKADGERARETIEGLRKR